jgi:hypothetical protein
MANTPAKTPTLLLDLRKYLATAKLDDVPYDKLLQTVGEAGWFYRARQAGVEPWPDSVMVHFEISIGRDDAFEFFDTISVKVGAGPGPVSMAARSFLPQSLIYLFFNRLPPAAITDAPPASVQREMIDMKDRDVVLPAAAAADDDQQEYVPEPATLVDYDVVARREPDGLPIFADLNEMGPDTRGIIDAVIAEIEVFAETATIEQLDALAVKNPGMLNFLFDLGTKEERDDMKLIIDRRKNLLAVPATTPRRRRAA